MPTCPFCKGSGMVPVSAARPAYRPCPTCSGTGTISEGKADERQRQAQAREKKKDRGLGWTMILIGLGIAYGALGHVEDLTLKLIMVGAVIVCLTVGAKNL